MAGAPFIFLPVGFPSDSQPTLQILIRFRIFFPAERIRRKPYFLATIQMHGTFLVVQSVAIRE